MSTLSYPKQETKEAFTPASTRGVAAHAEILDRECEKRSFEIALEMARNERSKEKSGIGSKSSE